MAGISSRTLRHYDAIGLIEPAWTGAGGRRQYGRPELLRLQEILLLRELGLPLDEIAGLLDSEAGKAESQNEALHRHLDRLREEHDRIDRMINAVEETLSATKRGEEMNAEKMFEGFAANPYEAEARERWGDEVVDESNERLRAAGPEVTSRLMEGFDQVHEHASKVFRAGHAPDSPEAAAVVREHYALVSHFWDPDADAYRGLARMYVDDERFRRNIGDGDDLMVMFLRDSIITHADDVAGR